MEGKRHRAIKLKEIVVTVTKKNVCFHSSIRYGAVGIRVLETALVSALQDNLFSESFVKTKQNKTKLQGT